MKKFKIVLALSVALTSNSFDAAARPQRSPFTAESDIANSAFSSPRASAAVPSSSAAVPSSSAAVPFRPATVPSSSAANSFQPRLQGSLQYKTKTKIKDVFERLCSQRQDIESRMWYPNKNDCSRTLFYNWERIKSDINTFISDWSFNIDYFQDRKRWQLGVDESYDRETLRRQQVLEKKAIARQTLLAQQLQEQEATARETLRAQQVQDRETLRVRQVQDREAMAQQTREIIDLLDRLQILLDQEAMARQVQDREAMAQQLLPVGRGLNPGGNTVDNASGSPVGTSEEDAIGSNNAAASRGSAAGVAPVASQAPAAGSDVDALSTSASSTGNATAAGSVASRVTVVGVAGGAFSPAPASSR